MLTIDLDVEFGTLILVIRAGRLRAIDLGTATVRTRLRYRNFKLIEPQPSAPLAFSRWPLPGEVLAIG